jgi:hypothetical protein
VADEVVTPAQAALDFGSRSSDCLPLPLLVKELLPLWASDVVKSKSESCAGDGNPAVAMEAVDGGAMGVPVVVGSADPDVVAVRALKNVGAVVVAMGAAACRLRSAVARPTARAVATRRTAAAVTAEAFAQRLGLGGAGGGSMPSMAA